MARKVAKSRARHQARRMTYDGVTPEEILERDGWRCQIEDCTRRPIRKDLRYPHPRSASIDHIIPLAETDDDSARNKRAAHLVCNLRRGARGGNEQLVLLSGVVERDRETFDYTHRSAGRRDRRTALGRMTTEQRAEALLLLERVVATKRPDIRAHV